MTAIALALLAAQDAAWLVDDFSAAMAQAKKESKPLFVVFR